MSLLTIGQNVAGDIPVAVPETIIGNSDETAKMILRQAQNAGEWLARRADGGWVSMIREYDFVTTAIGPLAGTLANSGPNGVGRITGLSSTTGLGALTFYVSGPGIANNTIIATVDSSSQVTLNQAGVAPLGSGSFSFGKSDYALPSDFRRPVDNTFWDRGRFWSMRGPQSPQQWQLYKSSVIGRASIQRRFRFRYIGGNNVLSIDPTPFDNNDPLVFEYVSNAWCESDDGVAQTQWLADTDIGVIDEYLIQLATRWRVLRRLGLSYNEELDECEREVNKALASDGGAAILDLAPSDSLTLIGPWNIPETGYGNVNGS